MTDWLGTFIAKGSSAPTSPQLGQLWFDTGVSKLKEWDGTTWSTMYRGPGLDLQDGAGHINDSSDTYTANNNWIVSVLSGNIRLDHASGNWINDPFGGQNGWAAIAVSGVNGGVEFYADTTTGNVQRTYTQAQFGAKRIARLLPGKNFGDFLPEIYFGTVAGPGPWTITVPGGQDSRRGFLLAQVTFWSTVGQQQAYSINTRQPSGSGGFTSRLQHSMWMNTANVHTTVPMLGCRFGENYSFDLDTTASYDVRVTMDSTNSASDGQDKMSLLAVSYP